MIRRRIGDEFQLIAQNDHAVFSGFLAQHVGNEQFDKLEAEVVSAIAAHDAGWPLHDDEPALNGAGEPLHVFEMPMGLATQIWSASAQRAEQLGPYAALLVSLHQLALSDIARQHHAAKAQERAASPRDLFNLNKFQHSQIERQEALRRELGMRTDIPLQLGLANPGAGAREDRLRFHFRMLTLCDRISLEQCCGEILFPCIEEVYGRAGAAAVSIRTTGESDESIAVNPWPFDEERLTSEIRCRRVPARHFESEQEFRDAYFTSEVGVMRVEVRLNSHD